MCRENWIAGAIVAALLLSAVSSATASPYSDAVLAESPLGYWRLDGLSDATANSNHATQVGSLGCPLGAWGAPLVYDPDNWAPVWGGPEWNGYIEIPAGEPASGTIFDFSKSDPFTLMAWIFTSEPGVQMIIGKSTNATEFRGYNLYLNEGRLSSSVQTGDGTYAGVQGSTGLSDGSVDFIDFENQVYVYVGYHFVAVTYDGSQSASGFKLYVDGSPEATSELSDNLAGHLDIMNDEPVQLGMRGTSTFPFNGVIDEPAIFGSELTGDQIQALYAFYDPSPRQGTPEPATLTLLALAGLGLLRRKKA